MVKLAPFIEKVKDQSHSEKDHKFFKTIGFDPEELLEVKEMDEKELTYLMLFCNIRTFNDMPVEAMSEDEMRMAYVVWRAEKIKERSEQVSNYIRRGKKWTDYLTKALAIATNR